MMGIFMAMQAGMAVLYSGNSSHSTAQKNSEKAATACGVAF